MCVRTNGTEYIENQSVKWLIFYFDKNYPKVTMKKWVENEGN